MNTKNILTVIGTIMGLQAIAIFAGAESITTEAFAALKPDATGIQIGTMLHEAMAVMCMMVAIIVLSARSLEQAAAAKVLMGASIGIAITTAHGFYNLLTTVVAPPLPILLIMGALAVVGFVTAMKANGGSTDNA
mgnify:CR=1 FL=1